MRDSPKHKQDLEAAHSHVGGPAEQCSRLDSMVFSSLSKAEEMHPSASFPLSLCGPACPCPTTHQWPCVQPRQILLTHSGAPHRQQGLLNPCSPQPLLQFSVLPSSSQCFVADPFRMVQPVPCRKKRQELVLAATRTSHWHGVTPKQGCGVYWCYSGFVLVHLRLKFERTSKRAMHRNIKNCSLGKFHQ